MKNVLLGMFLIFLTNAMCYGQNKKEQIYILNQRVDSLLSIVSNQSSSIVQLKSDLSDKNQVIAKKDKEVNALQRDLKNRESQLKEKNNQINKLSTTVDSLKIYKLNAYSRTDISWYELHEYLDTNGFSYNNNGLAYNDENFRGEIAIDGALNGPFAIWLSPLSGNKKYSFCFESQAAPGLYLLNLETMDSKNISPGFVTDWLSWSPNIDYAILEIDNSSPELIAYNLIQNSYEVLDFNKDLKKENGNIVEKINFDLKNLLWVSDTTFSIVANITCNDYADDSCDYKKSSVVLRSYKYFYDIKKDQIVNTIVID